MNWRLVITMAGCAATLFACAVSTEFPDGALPIDVRPQAKLSAERGDRIIIRGAVWGEADATIVLRIDDGKSSSYATRVNEERQFPPGPFVWSLPLAGTKTSGGRPIDADDIRRLILFDARGRASVRIDQFSVEQGSRLPVGALGFGFGAPDAPVIAGLERVSPGDKRIVAGRPVAVRRPGLDPVIADGVAGLEAFHVDWPKGLARVSLWTEDIGEWENLPRVLRRRVRVNGVDVVDETRTPSQWIEQRYLAGRDREASATDDAWTAYGQYRGGLISTEVAVAEKGVTIELAGEGATATFVSAIVVESAAATTARDFVEGERRAWMNGNFPVSRRNRVDDIVPSFDVSRPSAIMEPLHAVVGEGSGARLSFALRAGASVQNPIITSRPPSLKGASLGIDVFAAQWRLERIGAGSNLMARRASVLRGDPASLPIRPDVARRYEVWITADRAMPAGTYSGSIDFALSSGVATVPIVVDVLPINLPEAPAAAGFYLDEAPHLGWFDETRGDRGRQLSCDLATLRRFGVTGNAPALATPTAGGLAEFVADSRRARDGGARAPWFAYAPLKRLLASEAPATLASRFADVASALDTAGIPAPVWSIADEPGNPDQNPEGLATVVAGLRARVPNIRLGGQFNDPRDIKFANIVDVALINQGFGIDVERVAMLRGLGREVWLYNTGQPRFTAGLWLWTTGAKRYLQWHARMPTADPFDPTDGREGDVQIFAPTPTVCPARQDIHTDLFEMAEGLVDQQWLAWLESRVEPAARALAKHISADMATDWKTASENGVAHAREVRASIIALARGLN